MSRNGSGVYSKPVGTTASPNTTITSTQFNTTIDDIVDDLNLARPIVAGGTGATSASAARTALGVALAQTSVTDATAASGLIVGGFGIGGAGVTAAGDLNNAIYGGIYTVGASTANTPDSTGPTGCSCIVTRFDADNIQQVFLYRGSTATDVRVYVRHMRAASWGAWGPVFSRATLLGTVSEASGVPTGAAMQRSSGVNGEYVRFADGTQIASNSGCTFAFTATTALNYTWTFPAAFVATPNVVVTLPTATDGVYTGIAAVDVGHFFQATGTASILLGLRKVDGATDFASGDSITNVRVTAFGRWF
jgi:hypothetical protein